MSWQSKVQKICKQEDVSWQEGCEIYKAKKAGKTLTVRRAPSTVNPVNAKTDKIPAAGGIKEKIREAAHFLGTVSYDTDVALAALKEATHLLAVCDDDLNEASELVTAIGDAQQKDVV